jgi:hypothetical protein
MFYSLVFFISGMDENKTDYPVMCGGIIFGLLFALGVVRIMVGGTDGFLIVLIGLIGCIGVYLYDKKKKESV